MTNLSTFILEQLDTLLVVFNQQGQIQYVNPSVTKVLGYEPKNMIGKNWLSTSYQSKEEVFEVKENTISLLKSKTINKSFTIERKVKHNNGIVKWVVWRISVSPENLIIGIGQDITEQKIEKQKTQATNLLLRNKNKELIDSISYSKRIQQAILPKHSLFQSKFNEAFVLYKPKNIISGDFYWYYERNNLVYVACIDCTGHGVSGALMTILTNSLMKNIIKQNNSDPGLILKILDDYLYDELNLNNENKTPDGFDIALCVFDFENKKLNFSGAFRSLVLIRNMEFIEFKGARYPIGFYDNIDKNFETTETSFLDGDCFYLFSDGYIDQFGGEKNKKFNKKAFRNLLLEIQYLNLEEQEGYLDYVFNNWKQQNEQTDDICIIGLKI
jgi:PAS domain S-box-containing protein